MSIADGTYTIYNVAQDRNVDLEGGNIRPGTRVIGYFNTGNPNQKVRWATGVISWWLTKVAKWIVKNVGGKVTFESILSTPGKEVYITTTAIADVSTELGWIWHLMIFRVPALLQRLSLIALCSKRPRKAAERTTSRPTMMATLWRLLLPNGLEPRYGFLYIGRHLTNNGIEDRMAR